MIYGSGYADLLKSAVFGRHNTLLKAKIEKLSSEAVTGLASDPFDKLGGNVTALAQIEHRQRVTQAEHANIKAAEGRLQVIQDVFSWMQSTNDNIAQKTIAEMAMGSRRNVDMRAAEAEHVFKSMVAKLRTQHGSDYVFSGQALDKPPLKEGEKMVAELKSVTAGLTTEVDIVAAVDSWMNNTASGFLEDVPNGVSETSHALIDGSRNVKTSASALKPSVVETLKGWALTLVASNRSDISDDEARSLVSKGANMALNGGELLRAEQATYGRDQELVETAGLEKEAEQNGLKKAKLSLLEADQYEASVALNEYRSSMERLYAITARISNLSLVNFIK